MDDILKKIAKEATGNRYKSLRDACSFAWVKSEDVNVVETLKCWKNSAGLTESIGGSALQTSAPSPLLLYSHGNMTTRALEVMKQVEETQNLPDSSTIPYADHRFKNLIKIIFDLIVRIELKPLKFVLPGSGPDRYSLLTMLERAICGVDRNTAFSVVKLFINTGQNTEKSWLAFVMRKEGHKLQLPGEDSMLQCSAHLTRDTSSDLHSSDLAWSDVRGLHHEAERKNCALMAGRSPTLIDRRCDFRISFRQGGHVTTCNIRYSRHVGRPRFFHNPHITTPHLEHSVQLVWPSRRKNGKGRRDDSTRILLGLEGCLLHHHAFQSVVGALWLVWTMGGYLQVSMSYDLVSPRCPLKAFPCVNWKDQRMIHVPRHHCKYCVDLAEVYKVTHSIVISAPDSMPPNYTQSTVNPWIIFEQWENVQTPDRQRRIRTPVLVAVTAWRANCAAHTNGVMKITHQHLLPQEFAEVWYDTRNPGKFLCKTQELIVDFRKRKPGEHKPVLLKGSVVNISEDLSWDHHVEFEETGISPNTLANLYRCTVESILTGCICVFTEMSAAPSQRRSDREQRHPQRQFPGLGFSSWKHDSQQWGSGAVGFTNRAGLRNGKMEGEEEENTNSKFEIQRKGKTPVMFSATLMILCIDLRSNASHAMIQPDRALSCTLVVVRSGWSLSPPIPPWTVAEPDAKKMAVLELMQEWRHNTSPWGQTSRPTVIGSVQALNGLLKEPVVIKSCDQILNVVDCPSAWKKVDPLFLVFSETLESENGAPSLPTYQLRECCLVPLKLALESKNAKLAQHALAGMQKLLMDERLAAAEKELEERQLLNQMLDSMKVTPSLNEDLQVEVMKVLLCITYSSTFEINGSAILKIAEVCIETYVASCHQRSINTAVRATLSQMFSDLAQQLRLKQESENDGGHPVQEESHKGSSISVEALCEDVVSVLAVLYEKLQTVVNNIPHLQLLYLECILSMLSSSSPLIHGHKGFTDLLWRHLCPALIVILGNPTHDKTISSAHGASLAESEAALGGVSDHGRGSGCSSMAPTPSGPVARTIYYIAVELVRLVGCMESLRPVLQSLYHRLLLYPPPQHRVEAIKIMKEILSSPQRLYDLAGPTVYEGETRRRSSQRRKSHLDLHKIIMDGMTEACVKGGIEACYAAVSCARALLGGLDQLSRGKGLAEEQVHHLLRYADELKGGGEPSRESVEISEADFRWQRRLLSAERARWETSPDVSVSITADTGRCTALADGMGQTTPEESCRREWCPSDAGETLCQIAMPGPEQGDQLEAAHRRSIQAPPDSANFLSVDPRGHKMPGSRRSESNFSVDEQDISRTEFDSCDQYSTAAEKDSGRSDVSEIGSDNCSLVDEDQALRDCPGHRSLRGASLTLNLLKNQEAEQHSARIFVQSLVTILPGLLTLQATEEVDSSLQSFASVFCSGLQSELLRSPGPDTGENMSCQPLMNADGLYLVAFHALSLSLKLNACDYYRRKPAPVPISLKEFVRQVQSSRVLVVLSQAWIEEVYHQVLDRNLLGEAGYWGTAQEHSLPFIVILTDMDGLGSSAVGGQMISAASGQSPLAQEKNTPDSVTAGMCFARFILIGCWKNLIDMLSTPLTGRVTGSSKGLAFILGMEGIKDQNQKERDAICMSLDGLRKAARLSCALGVAANCASALAQMSAASCVQDEKEEKDVLDTTDPIAQVKQRVEQKLEQIGRPQGVQLHTAHVLCMDAILGVGLEMGSHNADCWQHVFRVCEYINTLEHSHFSDGGSQPPITITQAQQFQDSVPSSDTAHCPGKNLSPKLDASMGNPVIQSVTIQELIKENYKGKAFDCRGGGVLNGSNAAKAVCTLSSMADKLFEDATVKLNLNALVGFLNQLRKASQAQLFDSATETVDYSLAMPGEARSTFDRRSALHLFRLGDVMLRIVRSRSRPLLHLMKTWGVVGPHLAEAACHKERQVSQKAVSFIHDILTEVLTDWNELPHFHFNEALFRPFEHIMQLELCDEDVQDQVITSIGELVEAHSPQIQSGWRPLFSALKTVHSNKSDVKEYLIGEYSMGKSQVPVFDVFEAFLNTDNIQVFANAATDYIMCLMKFVKGLGGDDCKEVGNSFLGSGSSSSDLCLPALDYLRKCSQLLAKIYKMPSKPIFHGAQFTSLPFKGLERSISSEDGIETTLSEFDDDTGLIQVWILLLEQLTTAISNCPRQHQAPTLDLLFELLREVTKVPGPGFGIFAVVHLLLPVMSLWLQRNHGDQSYWEVAAANFKHAIGLSSELVMEHIHCFIQSDIGYENSINIMLKDLFKLLVSCIAEPTETISRVGCSCIRYVLVTAGPVFTDEMWRLACYALQDAFTVTLEPVKNLLACFQSGSESFSGDACEVKVAAPLHSASAEAEYWRIRAMAQQVFLLDTQCSPKTPNSREGFEHAQSCVLIIELPPDEKPNGHTQRRIPFRTIVVSLLSHQVLLQNLYDVLLEEFVKGPTPSDAPDRTIAFGESRAAGFLRYISMQNLAVIFDLLLDSYWTAREFDTRPGLKYLLMKVSGVGGAANLYRQSAMSFSIYFQALICAILTNQEHLSAEQVKKILYEEEEGELSSDSSQQCSSEDEDIFEETAQVSPPRGKEKRQWRARIPSISVQPGSNADWAWLVRRLHKLCLEVCTNYIQLHLDLQSCAEESLAAKGEPLVFLPACPSEGSSPSCASGKEMAATPPPSSPSSSEGSWPRAGTQGASPRRESGWRLGGKARLGDDGTDGDPRPLPGSPEQGRGKEWWESAGSRIYTIATDRTIGKLVLEYKRRKQQNAGKGETVAGGGGGGGRGPDSPLQRPQHLLDQGRMRHSFSAGAELLRQERRPRSGSTASCQNVSLRDTEGQMQAWTNMILTVLNQIQLLPDQTFTALQPSVYPSISQLTCHVTDVRVRQAVREWLGRVGRVYDIIM
ncbi:brefeldin A-inhibited guanine nucleotide-exchange protein 3 [Narcine bancroftii]|uniref:brefeldin A-inhibited guanine nucleotide-exchange protein 3 n=1 Tax=Narcine bancroftii TaxID=1343680 RepID=UPI003831E6EA